MANPTTNYGWVLPTPTDLVTDLPADFDVALQGVDTTTKALNPSTTLGDIEYRSSTANTNTRLGIGTTGQVLTVSGGVPAWATATAPPSGATLITRTTFSASSSVTVDNLFTDTYENYLVMLQTTCSAADVDLQMRARYGTTTHSTGTYESGFAGVQVDAPTTFRSVCSSGSTFWNLGRLENGAPYYNINNFTFYRVSSSARLNFTGNVINSRNNYMLSGGGTILSSQTWGGLNFFPASGTLTGQISVYGLAE
jgi:hypothetical protein